MMYVIVPRVVTRLVGIGPSDFHTMTSMESSCAFLKKSPKKCRNSRWPPRLLDN